jgi:hypothetical protein
MTQFQSVSNVARVLFPCEYCCCLFASFVSSHQSLLTTTKRQQDRMQCTCAACLAHTECPTCREKQRQYYVAFTAVKAQITERWFPSFYTTFNWIAASSPEEKGDWINQWIEWAKWEQPSSLHLFCLRIQDLLDFHHLRLKYHPGTNVFSCDLVVE